MTYTLHQYLKEAGLKTIPSSLPDFEMEFTPRTSQITGLNRVMRDVRFGLFDDAGTGKTLIMQAWALLNIASGNNVVCLMPPVLLDQFVETMEENFHGSHRWLTWRIIDKGPAWRERRFSEWTKLRQWPGMLLMTYEMFVKLRKIMWDKNYRVVITDEAQKLRGSESIFHLTVMNYTEHEHESSLLLATGTPLHHSPIDGYAMTRLTNREAYASLNGFKRRHTDRHTEIIQKRARNRAGQLKLRKIRVEVIDNYKNLSLLNKNLYKHARRVEKSEVLSLKHPQIIPIRLNMEPAHKKIYNTLSKERMLEIGENRVITATEQVQLREHLMGIACNPNAYSEKPVKNVMFDMVVELIDSIGPDKKVALYAHHNSTVEAVADELERRLDKEGWPESPRLIYGGPRATVASNRASAKLFKSDPNTKLIIGHPNSGGVGLNLQKVCHHIIMVEPTPIHGDFSQVIARVQRDGQLYPVIIYVLILNGTVYPKMVQTMLDNNDMASTVNLDTATFRKWISGEVEASPF